MSTETDNNKKFINVTQLDRALQALNNRHEEVEGLLLDSVDSLAQLKAEQTELERVEGMFGGKSLRYVTQEEYDALSDEEKADETIAWCVTDESNVELQEQLYYDIESKVFQEIDLTNQVYSEGLNAFELNTLNLRINETHSIRVTMTENNEDVIYEGYFITKDNTDIGMPGIGAINLVSDGVSNINIYFDGDLPAVLQNMLILDKVAFDSSQGFISSEDKAIIAFNSDISSINKVEIELISKDTVPLTTEILKTYKLITDEEKATFARKAEIPEIKYSLNVNHGTISLDEAVAIDSGYAIDYDSVFNVIPGQSYELKVQFSDYSTATFFSDPVNDSAIPRYTAFFNFTNPVNGEEVNVAFRDGATSSSVFTEGKSYLDINTKNDILYMELSCVPQTLTTEFLKENDFQFVTTAEKNKWNNTTNAITNCEDKLDNALMSNGSYDSLNTEDKTIVGAINELEYEIFNAQADIVGLEEYKQDKEDENLNTENKTIVGAINEIEDALNNIGDINVSDAETINGYSVWVGTSAELDQIEDRDENTIYFEIDEEADTSNKLVDVEIVDGILTLTNDKRQKAEMVDGTEIVLPTVTNFTEIHLYFSTLTDLTLIFPAGKYQKTPVINANKTYEFIFTYIGEWLIGYVEYGN